MPRSPPRRATLRESETNQKLERRSSAGRSGKSQEPAPRLMGSLQEALGNLHERAARWLGYLSKKGISAVMNEGTPVSSKQASGREVSAADRAVRLHNGQIVWLRADIPREGLHKEYRGIGVFDTTPKTDKAVIAAITALETERVEDEDLKKAFLLYKLGTAIPAEPFTTDWLKVWEQRFEEAALSNPELRGARAKDDMKAHQYTNAFGYAEELLRHYRPNYDDLDRQEQLALVKGVFGRINTFHKALEELVAFAEYGSYDLDKGKSKKLKSAAKNVQRHVNAALLRDVEGAENKDIGVRLGARLPSPKKWKGKRDASTARGWVAQGLSTVKAAYGEDGWATLVASKKAQRVRWAALTEEERELEMVAEQIAAMAGLSPEEALQIIDYGELDQSKVGFGDVTKAFIRGVEKMIE